MARIYKGKGIPFPEDLPGARGYRELHPEKPRDKGKYIRGAITTILIIGGITSAVYINKHFAKQPAPRVKAPTHDAFDIMYETIYRQIPASHKVTRDDIDNEKVFRDCATVIRKNPEITKQIIEQMNKDYSGEPFRLKDFKEGDNIFIPKPCEEIYSK